MFDYSTITSNFWSTVHMTNKILERVQKRSARVIGEKYKNYFSNIIAVMYCIGYKCLFALTIKYSYWCGCPHYMASLLKKKSLLNNWLIIKLLTRSSKTHTKKRYRGKPFDVKGQMNSLSDNFFSFFYIIFSNIFNL